MLPPSRRLAAGALAAAMMLTGANVAFGKAIVAEIPVYVFVLFRFVVATAALAVLARAEPGPRLSSMTGAGWRDLVLMALLGMIGFTVLMLEGLKRTSAADAGIITAALPAIVAVLGVVFARERLAGLQLGAVALATAGLLLVQLSGVARGASTLAGNLLVFGAVLCEASFVMLGKRLAPPYKPLRLALGANAVGLVLSLPLAAQGYGAFDPFAVPASMWLLGVWYALAASVFCLWLWYWGLPYVETWLAGLTTAALPVTALAVSVLFLHETLDVPKLAGAALVVGGIILGAWTRPVSGLASPKT